MRVLLLLLQFIIESSYFAWWRSGIIVEKVHFYHRIRGHVEFVPFCTKSRSRSRSVCVVYMPYFTLVRLPASMCMCAPSGALLHIDFVFLSPGCCRRK